MHTDGQAELDTPSLGSREATWCQVRALASVDLGTDPGLRVDEGPCFSTREIERTES